jgi:hypothetical protein
MNPLPPITGSMEDFDNVPVGGRTALRIDGFAAKGQNRDIAVKVDPRIGNPDRQHQRLFHATKFSLFAPS